MVSLPIELAVNDSMQVCYSEGFAEITAETAGFRAGTALPGHSGHGDGRYPRPKIMQFLQTFLSAHARSDLDIQQHEIREGHSRIVPDKQVFPARKRFDLETETFEHQDDEISDGIVIIHDKNQARKRFHFLKSPHSHMILNSCGDFHKIPTAREIPVSLPVSHETADLRVADR